MAISLLISTPLAALFAAVVTWTVPPSPVVPCGARIVQSSNAVADAASINASLAGLQNATAAAYVGYALNHQPYPCVPDWPNGIVPTTQMSAKFYSGCWLLSDPLLTRVEVAYVLSLIPNWPLTARR